MKLYALLDINSLKNREKNIEWFVKKALSLNASLIQYRNKDELSHDIKKQDITLIKSLCDIPLIVNDDITLVEYCDGLHLGQEDILKFDENIQKASVRVRSILKDKIFGLSTHNEKEILRANDLPVDYIGLGAYRATSTKDVSNILGEKTSHLASLSTKDVALIGGVKLDDKVKNVTYLVIGSGLYEN
ncbi:MAG: thiamine phosphate synthase [Campylobacteraceae bacterium]